MISVVSILDSDNYQVLFNDANLMNLDILDEIKVTQFQVEDGTTRSDHTVRLPIVINGTMLINENARVAFTNLRQAYLENRLLIIQTRVNSYPSMLITGIPHTETIDNLLGVTVNIRFEEWRTVAPVYGELPLGTTRNPAQSSTVNRGQQQTTNADGEAGAESRRKGSILSGVFN